VKWRGEEGQRRERGRREHGGGREEGGREIEREAGDEGVEKKKIMTRGPHVLVVGME